MNTRYYLSWEKMSGLILSMILFLTMGLSAQEKPVNSLTDGSWSMQFRISRDLTLTSFEGALISAKKHISDKTALRFGIDMNYLHLSDDLEGYNQGERKRSQIKLGFKTQVVKYSSPESKLNFYYGIGPNIGFSSFNDEYSYIHEPDSSLRENTNYSRDIDLGLLGSWGLEWFFAENISLLAEYGGGLELSFQRKEKNSNDYNSQIEKTTQFRFFSDNVNFGLSVYF